ncbi:ABC transporter substrate-binding protein [Candidatus Latescibacterota bacterium]
MPIKSAIKIAIFVSLIIVFVMNTTGVSAQEDDAGALFKRGLILFKQSKFVSARLDFKDIIDNHDSSEFVIPSHMMLAKTYFNLGDFELAESTAAAHRVLYTASPYFEWTQYLTAACKFRMGDNARAAAILSELASKTNNTVIKLRSLSTIKYIIMPIEGSESVSAILAENGLAMSVLEDIEPSEQVDNIAVIDIPAPPSTPRETVRNIAPQQQQSRNVRKVFKSGSALKIGLLTPLSGINSDMGNALMEGIRSVMANNPLAGERQIELIVEDTGSSPVTAVLKTRKLAGEGVIAIIGPILSDSTIPAAVESQSLGIPFIAPTTTTVEFTSIGKYVFQLNFNPIVQAEALAELAYDTLNFTNFAVIADNDPWGIAVAEKVSEEMEKRGAVNIWSDYIAEDLSTSSDELFTKIREGAPQSSANTDSMVIYNYGTAFPDTVYITQEVLLSEERRPMPIDTIDCIFVSAASEEAIRVASLIMEYNIRTVILGDSGWWSNRRAFRGNERYLEGAIIVSSDSGLSGGREPSYSPSVSESVDSNNILITKGADSCSLLIHCLQNGAGNPEELVEMLESIKDYKGVSSDITIDPDRHTNNAVSFIQIRDGKNFAISNDTIFNQIKTFTEDSFETDGAALPVSQ